MFRAPRDLAKMVDAAHRYPLIREFSTTSEGEFSIAGRAQQFRNTNTLVKSPTWEIGLSKTGYISEAGKCLVMQAWLNNKPTIIVLLDSWGKLTRIGDANRIKRWVESASLVRPPPAEAPALANSPPPGGVGFSGGRCGFPRGLSAARICRKIMRLQGRTRGGPLPASFDTLPIAANGPPVNPALHFPPERIVIATRESRLALWQAEHVRSRLQHSIRLRVELLGMTTRGDQILDRPLAKVGGKGLFVKELETALLDRRADLAVHSMKDVPM
jgi:hypothetical protein